MTPGTAGASLAAWAGAGAFVPLLPLAARGHRAWDGERAGLDRACRQRLWLHVPTTVDRRRDETLQRHAEPFHEALSDFVRGYSVGERDQICCHDISLTQCYALDALVRRGR